MEHDVRVASGRIARVTMEHGVMEKVMRRDLETFFFFFIAIKCYSPGQQSTCLLILLQRTILLQLSILLHCNSVRGAPLVSRGSTRHCCYRNVKK